MGSAGYDLPSDSFRSCTKFLQSDEETRANIVSANKGCAVCLRWSHEREACQKTRPCGQLTGGQACQLRHSPLLHGTDAAYVNVARSSNDSIILQMSKHKFKNNGMETMIFFDPGSTTSIIRHQLARKMKLKGVPKSFEIYRAGMKSPDILKTTKYTVPLREIDGTMSVRQMIGLDWITNKQTHSPDLVTIRSMFPHIPPEAIQYPTEEVGMLLGQDCGSLLPTGGEGRNSVGDLKIMTVKFGTGYVLSGKASAKPRVKESFSPEASAVANALLVTDNKAIHVNFLSCREPNFLECEEMAVPAPRKCLWCTRCQTCNFQRIEMSRKEEAEMRMISHFPRYTGIYAMEEQNSMQGREACDSSEEDLPISRKRKNIKAFDSDNEESLDLCPESPPSSRNLRNKLSHSTKKSASVKKAKRFASSSDDDNQIEKEEPFTTL